MEVKDPIPIEEDPILEVFEFCETCEPKVLKLIEYIRELETVQVVAKEALETMEWANKKLTVEQNLLAEERDKWKDKAEKTSQIDLDTKMQDIKNAEQKIINRNKLGGQ